MKGQGAQCTTHTQEDEQISWCEPPVTSSEGDARETEARVFQPDRRKTIVITKKVMMRISTRTEEYNLWLDNYMEKAMSNYSEILKMNREKMKAFQSKFRAIKEGLRAVVRETLRKNKVTVAFLQETKLQSFTQALARDIWYKRRPSWAEAPAHGTAGGISIFWDSNEVELIDKEEGLFSLALHFRSIKDNFQWAALAVYGPNSHAQRQEFWHELSAIIQLWSLPWVIGGDFNVSRFITEKSGGRSLSFDEAIQPVNSRSISRGTRALKCPVHLVQW
ncbi:hypothetical protein H6P81_012337 [Aristolochia fimbriata]|uniref:Endonuclease/exonuclease/phosphatase domain-containing protein n=1 Tax=Aristolochia fimbriata TaxID=158543 RepID=A0AAV7EBX3_ARIFI|nr:hypothetical protein H6P81_012337 [Aristolochia fimbriata]